MSEPVNVVLTGKITAHGEEVSHLELREPTTEDLMELGHPTLLLPSADGAGVGVEVRPKVIGNYIARLGKIPPSSVKQLSLKDFETCSGVVMGFFNNGGQ